jgi:hypothetical protein
MEISVRLGLHLTAKSAGLAIWVTEKLATARLYTSEMPAAVLEFAFTGVR